MSCTVGIQRLYGSQTHGVAGHSSTNEGNPSCMCFYSISMAKGDSLLDHIAGGMGQVGSRAIALGPIGQHELHSALICYSHTESIQPAP